jgi:hypothetical protein
MRATRRWLVAATVVVVCMVVMRPAGAVPAMNVRDCKALPSGGGYACVTTGGEIVFCSSWNPGSGLAYGCVS